MPRGFIRGVISLIGLAAVAGLTIPPLFADQDGAARASIYAEEPIGDIPGMRYVTLPDQPGLTGVERRRARGAALGDPGVRAAIGAQRASVVLIRPYGPADDLAFTDPCVRTPCVNATIYLYESNEILDVYLSGAGRVLRIERGRGQPPLSPAERRRAHRLAEADREVVELLARQPHTHPAVLTKPMWPAGVCDVHRCGTVLFMLGDFARTGIGRELAVTVDLSSGAIVSRTQIECSPDCRVGWRT